VLPKQWPWGQPEPGDTALHPVILILNWVAMGNFTLMRHGMADFPLGRERKLIGGCMDWVPLTPVGVAQVEARLPQLIANQFTQIISSPMTRALQSAALLSRGLNLPLQVEFDLHEWLPDLTFRFDSFAPVQQAINERQALGNEWPPGVVCNWEPFSRIRQRVKRVLSRYDACGPVLVVCHQTVIEALTGVELACAETIAYQSPAVA